ncbi:MAG: hypothetical protein NWE88_02090 [Candidatus Bathyarchaeota archaeon]|nr:hypothetical protein [Candidatus Bathyarchaeota archaeon]
MSDLSSGAKGRIGETLVALELEKRGWFVYRPDFEEKVDLIGLREQDEIFKYISLQVKTSFLTKDHSITVHKKKHLEDPTFYYVFCLIDTFEKQPTFIIVPSVELNEVMEKAFKTPSWKEKGAYTFHIPSNLRLGKWEKYRNRFKF